MFPTVAFVFDLELRGVPVAPRCEGFDPLAEVRMGRGLAEVKRK
jgi:hypothetical protein